MKRLSFILASLMMIMFIGSVCLANLDDFDGPNIANMWTLRDPADKSDISFAGGKMVMDLAAGADMYIRGTDAGVMLLTAPPDMDDFSVELLTNAAVDGTQPPACHVGIVFFNEAAWAYTAWGPYADTDIRLEDCVDASYRWRDQTLVGVDLADVDIDEDVYLKVTKTGDTLEFFTKGAADDAWISGGTDDLLGPNYTAGDYMVGIIAKSWGGSVDSTFEFDYFNIPEMSTSAVDSASKISTTWAELKK